MDFLSSLVYLAQSSPPAKSIDPIAFANQLLNGIGIVGILLLTGLGLAITFGVMRIINLAHGEFIMLGAYTTFVLQKNFKMDLLLTIPFAFLLTAAIGAIVEITIIRKLYGRPLETLLATWGLSIVLQGVVKLIFTAQLKYVKAPPYIKGNLSIFNAGGQSVEISYYRLFIFAVAIALLD
jgi:urea transport system permease protein